MLRRCALVLTLVCTVLLVTQAAHLGATSLPLAGAIVVIDPGHNGGNAADPSYIDHLVNAGGFWKACDTAGAATNSGYPEHAFTFAVAKLLQRDLRALGARVVLTRPNDHGVGPCITERAAIANRLHATVAVSLHGDGGPASGRGFEVIEPGLVVSSVSTTAPILQASRHLASDLRRSLDHVQGLEPSTYLGVAGIGTRDDLGGLNRSTVPKVLIECLNLRNASDALLATSPTWRATLAQGLTAGIETFLLGLHRHEPSTTTQPTELTTTSTTTTTVPTTTTSLPPETTIP